MNNAGHPKSEILKSLRCWLALMKELAVVHNGRWISQSWRVIQNALKLVQLLVHGQHRPSQIRKSEKLAIGTC